MREKLFILFMVIVLGAVSGFVGCGDDPAYEDPPVTVDLHEPLNPTLTSLTLMWDGSGSGDFDEYRLFYSTESTLPEALTDYEVFDIRTDTSVTLEGLFEGTIYWFAVGVWNNDGQWSGYSNIDSGSTMSWEVTRTIDVGEQPYGVVFDDDGEQAYVTNSASNSVSVISSSTDGVIATIDTLSNPRGIACDPGGS
ncbi:MAG: fibronectin type III domain-containing protein, partial [Candidatus Electryonea clarkiae]|nr:fibronectin type III domain-containing protein [Candidatus Electryonea clarkiae]